MERVELTNTGPQQVSILRDAFKLCITISTETLEIVERKIRWADAEPFQGVFTADHEVAVINKPLRASGHIYKVPLIDAPYLCYVVLSEVGEVHTALFKDEYEALGWCIYLVGLPYSIESRLLLRPAPSQERISL